MGNQREKNSTHVHMVSANPRLCVQILKFMLFMQAIWFLCPAHQNGLGSTAEDRHDSSTRQQTAEELTAAAVAASGSAPSTACQWRFGFCSRLFLTDLQRG